MSVGIPLCLFVSIRVTTLKQCYICYINSFVCIELKIGAWVEFLITKLAILVNRISYNFNGSYVVYIISECKPNCSFFIFWSNISYYNIASSLDINTDTVYGRHMGKHLYFPLLWITMESHSCTQDYIYTV